MFGFRIKKRRVMKIVIEYVLIENFIVNFFILKTTEMFIKEKAKLIILNSIFGSIIALVFPLFNLSTFASVFAKALVGSIMVCVSFDFKTLTKYLYIYFAFAFMTFVFGGCMSMLEQISNNTNVFLFTLFSGILFIFIKEFFKLYHKKKNIKDFQYSVRLFFNGKEVDEMGYLDSGNLLYDNISHCPIILISELVFEKLVGQNYYEFVLKNQKPEEVLKNCHYIPASTSMSNGKMLVFELENLQVIDKKNQIKEFKSQFVGLSFANFEKSFNSGLLLHSSQF